MSLETEAADLTQCTDCNGLGFRRYGRFGDTHYKPCTTCTGSGQVRRPDPPRAGTPEDPWFGF